MNNCTNPHPSSLGLVPTLDSSSFVSSQRPVPSAQEVVGEVTETSKRAAAHVVECTTRTGERSLIRRMLRSTLWFVRDVLASPTGDAQTEVAREYGVRPPMG